MVTSSIGDDAIPPASGGAADTSAPKGAMELPPDGATPSTPASGELVVSMWSRGRTGWDGWVYVYADGRLIWQRRGPLPATGWLEQRLTPEGVELVQAEILSTGLFDPAQSPSATDPDRPPPGSELGYGWPSYGDIQVRNGGRLIFVPGRPGQAWMPEFDRLQQRVAELQSWLPSSAWEDREIRAYVPSRYAICPYRFTAPLGWSRILPLLPPSAQELFADARPWRWDDRDRWFHLLRRDDRGSPHGRGSSGRRKNSAFYSRSSPRLPIRCPRSDRWDHRHRLLAVLTGWRPGHHRWMRFRPASDQCRALA